MNINKVAPDKHKYLQITSVIDKPPLTLYYYGTLPEARVPTVAIVGTRKPTAYGKEVTHRLAYDLAQQGIIIVSGLALGVDGLAHQAALEAGGTTLAVLPCGLPKIYPARHRDLAANIVAKGGALITEYTSDEEFSYQSNFLERNRIVAGLADAVLITEAAARSGTLNTAAHALAQGKEVFVVPGNITSPMSSGCNALIKQGAHVALSADDIIQVIAPELLRQQSTLPLGSTPAEIAILQQLKDGVRDGDEIQRNTGLSAVEITTALTMLELSGAIRGLGANQWTLR
ncbi:MAG: DNA-processing protein DprA [Acidobacteriota bacterium]